MRLQNVRLGLSNGTDCIMFYLLWTNEATSRAQHALLEAASPGEVVLVERPDFIVVSLKPDKEERVWLEKRMTWPEGGNLCTDMQTIQLANGATIVVPTSIHVPIGVFRKRQEPQCAKVTINKVHYKYSMHMFVIAHAITVWKVTKHIWFCYSACTIVTFFPFLLQGPRANAR